MSEEVVYIPEVVPIFPLPGVVLLPRVILPLHIFEPRYREMTADALQSDKIIAMALLKPGYETLYHTRRAPIHPVLGVGRILESEQLEDGKYHLLLQGVTRARVVAEVAERSYRLGRIEVLRAAAEPAEAAGRQLRQDLRETVEKTSLGDLKRREYWLQLFDAALGLDALTDLIAGSLAAQADAEWLQCLLAEPDAAARAALLLDHLRTAAIVSQRKHQPPANTKWNLN